MNFKQLIIQYSFDDIKQTLIRLYPCQEKNIKGYNKVFNNLLKKKPKYCDFTIKLEKIKDYFEENEFISVCGEKNNDRYALELTSWNKWLGMNVDEYSLKEYGDIEFICHCLWEMTFNGFNEFKIFIFNIKLNFQLVKIKFKLCKTYTLDEIMDKFK